jgi:hypothetical protein
MGLHSFFPRGNRRWSLQATLQRGLGCSSLPRVALRPVIPELIAVSRRLPEAVFSGSTAGWLHGLDLPPVDPVQVTVPDAHTSNRAGVHLRRARLAPVEIVRLRGLPVTSALRTAVDLGSNRVLVDAVIALDMALHRRIVGSPIARHPQGQSRRRQPTPESPAVRRLPDIFQAPEWVIGQVRLAMSKHGP